MKSLTDEQRSAYSERITKAIENRDFQAVCVAIEEAAKADSCDPATILGSFIVASIMVGRPDVTENTDAFLNYLCSLGTMSYQVKENAVLN